jgi:hypothetical protein
MFVVVISNVCRIVVVICNAVLFLGAVDHIAT